MIGIELLCKVIFKVSTNFEFSCTAFWIRIWQSVIEFIFKIICLFLINNNVTAGLVVTG